MSIVNLADRLKELVTPLLNRFGTMDAEEQQYQQEVQAIKQWWTDSRWRYTKRPFTAEQIAQKRGNINVQHPGNVLSKKLWKTVEQRFAVSASAWT